MQLHNSKERSQSWDKRALNRFYILSSNEHYPCHYIYVTKTKDQCISNTVFFKHWTITQPAVTPVDIAIQGINDLITTLNGTAKRKESDEFDALEQLLELVKNKLTQTNEPKKVTLPTTCLPKRTHGFTIALFKGWIPLTALLPTHKQHCKGWTWKWLCASWNKNSTTGSW